MALSIPVIAVATFGRDSNYGHSVRFDPKHDISRYDNYTVSDFGTKIAGLPAGAQLVVKTWQRLQPLSIAVLHHQSSGVVETFIFLGDLPGLQLEGCEPEAAVALATTNPYGVLLVPRRLISALHSASPAVMSREYIEALDPLMTCQFIGDAIPSINEEWRPWHTLEGNSNAVH